jgi:thioredoxin reductase (NADPH)
MSEKIQYAPRPKEKEPWDVAIVGSGPAALTAGIYTTRGAASTLIVGGEEWGGQLMLTTEVDNYPGFPDGIQGPELMKKMRTQVEKFNAKFLEKKVDSVDFTKRPFELFVGDEIYYSKTVIIATGAQTKWLNVPGEDEFRGKGVSSCAPCDAPFFKDRKVAVVGGGDSAMEEALVLTKYAPTVTVIHRRNELKASAAMTKKAKANEKIKWLWDSEVIEVWGDQTINSLNIKTTKDTEQSKKLKNGEIDNYNGEIINEDSDFIYWKMPIEGLFVAIGHKPATEVFQKSVETDEKGYVVTHHGTKTNIEDGVFVAGDVHDWHYRQAITAAGYGCMAGMDALKYLDQLKAEKEG